MRLCDQKNVIGLRVRDPGANGYGIVTGFQVAPHRLNLTPKVKVDWDCGTTTNEVPEMLEVVGIG